MAEQKLTKKAIRIFRQIEKIISDDPRKLNMDLWGMVYDKTHPQYTPRKSKQTFNSCGTVGCIAGWACILNNKTLEKRLRKEAKANSVTEWVGEAQLDEVVDAPSQAADILGLDDDQAQRLFYPQYWPQRFREAYQNATTAQGRKSATIKRIEFFIETNGSDGNQY